MAKKINEIPAQVVGVDYCSVNQETMETLGLSKENIVTDYEINMIGAK